MSKSTLTEEQRAAEIVKFADEVYKDSLAYHLKQPAAQKPEAGRSRIPGTSNEYHAERDAAALKLAEAERTEALRMAKLSQAGGADYTKIANFNALREKMQVARSSTQRQTAFQDFLQANSMDRTNPKKGVGAAKIKEALSDKHALIQGIKSTVTNSFAGEYEAETKAVAKLQAAARQRAERKTKGATALQRVFRGHVAKTNFQDQKEAAAAINATLRGAAVRAKLKKLDAIAGEAAKGASKDGAPKVAAGTAKAIESLVVDVIKTYKGDRTSLKLSLDTAFKTKEVQEHLAAFMKKHSGKVLGFSTTTEASVKKAFLADHKNVQFITKVATAARVKAEAVGAAKSLSTAGAVVGSNGDSSRAHSPRSNRSAGSNMGR